MCHDRLRCAVCLGRPSFHVIPSPLLLQVTIALTPLSGDPDLYVSTTPNPRQGAANWTSNSLSNETVVILPSDSAACSAPCRYYVGVQGFGGPATFTIMATTRVLRPTLLLNGLPQVGVGASGIGAGPSFFRGAMCHPPHPSSHPVV